MVQLALADPARHLLVFVVSLVGAPLLCGPSAGPTGNAGAVIGAVQEFTALTGWSIFWFSVGAGQVVMWLVRIPAWSTCIAPWKLVN